jgi:hypothetical protein
MERRLIFALLAGAALVGCGGQSAATTVQQSGSVAAPPASNQSKNTHHGSSLLVGKPIALIMSSSSAPNFQVRFRLRHAPPHDRQGALIKPLLGGAGADSPPTPFGVRSRHCYAAVIGDDFDAAGLRGAHVGSTVSLTIRIPHASSYRGTVTLGGKQSSDIASLGCGKL